MTQLIQKGKCTHVPAPLLDWLDPAIQHGWGGFFETMRYDDGAIKRFNRHMDRLRKSLLAWNLAWPCSDEEILGAIANEMMRIPEDLPCRVKIMVGEDPTQSHQGLSPRPTRAWVEARALEGEYLKPFHEKLPIRVGILKDYILPSTHPFSGHKSTQYAVFREALHRAQSRGWDEAILLNERMEITEASRFNIFWIVGDCIRTPARETGCLPGVMAGEIERLALLSELKIDRCAAGPQEFELAEAVFLTNSVAEIVPVKSIEAHELMSLADHPTGRRLLDAIATP